MIHIALVDAIVNDRRHQKRNHHLHRNLSDHEDRRHNCLQFKFLYLRQYKFIFTLHFPALLSLLSVLPVAEKPGSLQKRSTFFSDKLPAQGLCAPSEESINRFLPLRKYAAACGQSTSAMDRAAISFLDTSPFG